ncbi:malonic semialdehyde reductase [Croceicoccus sp. F390]|uniref:Malonic semialdehyde reductase n=1 Tax=Croceicoccus esteveae TaxID=3075597 RepID=A0ABU2ZEI2_9SPHN|nr:malonic semialdehyde reductase [Croceicoccus sp. F390]MDT0574785.1 malonic semialdehyde reductase [Croceicoccus sp. F390]
MTDPDLPQPLDERALDRLFHKARTMNGYLDRPVDEAILHRIWDLVRMGPTSANQLPARLIWCRTRDARDRLADCVSAGNADKIRNAPVSVIIAMDLDFHEQLPWLFPHDDARSWFADDEEARAQSAFRNSTLQGGYFIMAARALGLDCGPMSGFDADKICAQFLADQPRWHPNFISTLGYGDMSSTFARSPRPDFDVFNTIL